MMLGIQEYVIAGLATTLFGGWFVMDTKIDNRDATILKQQNEIILSKANYNTCSSSLARQNIAIGNLRVDINESMIELETWKNKPEEVRYEVIYKTIPADINLSSERCEDVKSIVDSLSTIDYDNL